MSGESTPVILQLLSDFTIRVSFRKRRPCNPSKVTVELLLLSVSTDVLDRSGIISRNFVANFSEKRLTLEAQFPIEAGTLWGAAPLVESLA
jgi:hypothetical protein